MTENEIKAKMYDITKKILSIKNLPLKDPKEKDYDKTGFVYDLEYLVDGLTYFYDVEAPKQNCTNNPTKARYTLLKRPTEHQIAYFNLTRGFPKELFGGHMCYVLKDLSSKYLIIPITSVKKNRPKKKFEIDIEIDNYKNDEQSRLRVSEMKCVDKQRLYPEKGFYDVKTEKVDIIREIKIITGLC